jgi:hypothetical protein
VISNARSSTNIRVASVSVDDFRAKRSSRPTESQVESSYTRQGPGIPALRPVQNSRTLADFPVLISPDGVSQFRVVKQLVPA